MTIKFKKDHANAHLFKPVAIIFLAFYMLCSHALVNAVPAWKPDYTLAKKLLHTPSSEIKNTFSSLIPNLERADYALLVSERLTYKLRNFSKAQIFLNIAEEELKHQPTAYRKIAILYMFRMYISNYENHYRDAIKHGKTTLENLRKDKNTNLKHYRYVLNTLSDIYYTIGDFKNSLIYAQQLVAEAKKSNNLNTEAGALYRAAFAHHKLGQKEKSETLANQSHDIYKKLENNNGLGDINKLLGSIYLSQKNHKKAKHSYDTAISYYKKARNHHGVANTLYNTGIMLKIQKNYGEAIIYLEDASFHFMESGSASGSGMAKMQLGKVHYFLDELDKAELLFNEAMTLLKKTNSINRIAQLEEYYAAYYLKLNQKDNAKQAYIRSLKIYRDANNSGMVKWISAQLNKLQSSQ